MSQVLEEDTTEEEEKEEVILCCSRTVGWWLVYAGVVTSYPIYETIGWMDLELHLR